MHSWQQRAISDFRCTRISILTACLLLWHHCGFLHLPSQVVFLSSGCSSSICFCAAETRLLFIYFFLLPSLRRVSIFLLIILVRPLLSFALSASFQYDKYSGYSACIRVPSIISPPPLAYIAFVPVTFFLISSLLCLKERVRRRPAS